MRWSLTTSSDTSYPPDLAKKTDTRARKFIAQHGDVSVELDALPAEVLRDRLRQEVESRMDMPALEATQRQELADRRQLIELLRDA